MRRMCFVYVVFFLAGCSGIKGWIHKEVDEEFVSKTFSVAQLREDVDYLVDTMQARHPAYHLYVDSHAVREKAEEIKHQITQPMTRKQVFPLMAQLTPLFNDGHSILFPLLAETTLLEEQHIQTFPFGVSIREGNIYLLRTYERARDNHTLYKGAQIQSIGAYSAEEILTVLEPLGHGETPQLRESMLSLLFYFWLNAVFDINGDIAVTLEYQGQVQDILLGNDDKWERAETESEDYALKILDKSVGYLRITSFDVEDDESYYKDFIQRSFAELSQKHISKLIIDVRGNTGGQSDAGAEVIQYLIDSPVTQGALAIEKLNADNNGWFGYKGEPGEMIELDVSQDGTIHPVDAEERFKGEVIVLMDRQTYSAGILFVTTIKDHQLGRLAGEPTGGFANQTGNLTPFYLPNSKLLMLAPARYIIRPSGDEQRKPLEPDYVLSGQGTDEKDSWLIQTTGLFERN